MKKFFTKPGLFILILSLLGCSGLEESQQEKVKRLNAKAQMIYRYHHEKLFLPFWPERRIRENYPWENQYVGNQPKITKEYFRCKGNGLNPLKTSLNSLDQTVYLFDCGGSGSHSLPIKGSDEFIYPVLIDLLNYIQYKTGKKVVIACGHRCPVHNNYVGSSLRNQSSKHQIGAEVDFYIEGLEKESLKVVELLIDYYQQNPLYEGRGDYLYFRRFEGVTDVSMLPWYNKEIFIKYNKSHEGRDLDNNHTYPYITIQVRYDKEENKPVTYTWHSAFNGYRRS